MNANAKLWVEALRSGRYEQGTQRLATVDTVDDGKVSYCCLGVACELYRDAGNPLARTFEEGEFDNPAHYRYGDPNRDYSDSGEQVGSTGTLPNAVREWLGLNTNDGGFHESVPVGDYNGRTATGLTGLNDRGGSFARIAEVIESAPRGLFKTIDVPVTLSLTDGESDWLSAYARGAGVTQDEAVVRVLQEKIAQVNDDCAPLDGNGGVMSAKPLATDSGWWS